MGRIFDLSRTMARSMYAYIDGDAELRAGAFPVPRTTMRPTCTRSVDPRPTRFRPSRSQVLRHLKAFPVALKQHLRGEREITELAGTLETQEMNEIADADNMPLAICTSMSLAINAVKVSPQQSVNALLWWSLDDKINAISQVITDCERLVRTPVPLAYSVHTSRLLSLWTGTLPLVLVGCFRGWMRLLTVPCTAFTAYALLCTEELGHLIEEPFGAHADRPEVLPLQRYCDALRLDLDASNRLEKRAKRQIEEGRIAQLEQAKGENEKMKMVRRASSHCTCTYPVPPLSSLGAIPALSLFPDPSNRARARAVEQAPGSEVIEQTIAAKVAAAAAEGADATVVASPEIKAAPNPLRPEAEAEAWAAARAAAKAAEESAADGLFPEVEAPEAGAVATEPNGDVCDWTNLDDNCK